ncbi:hypothetical protein Cgig2_016691 [Carnegiea gigantea]|uniref:C3H1-type domain-containing protein n=1 Tax=Carnegiea gigantea TaxID=171969 RepID=A0A9Q1KZW2_9CARY|nr:hypothetical protein Cgig2_016691 [Carnegiea gigantea]
MGSSSGAAVANDSMAELFGRSGRRPLLSNTLRTLSRIYSLFPEENPFAQFPDFPPCYTSAVWRACNAPQKSLLRPTSDGGGNDPAPRSEKEASIELDGPGTREVKNLPTHNDKSDVGSAEVLCEEGGVNVSEMTIDELTGGKETETVDKVTSNEKDANNKISEVHNVAQGLLGIERILMDESDDLGLLQMSDKDINFDILKDLDSFTETDGFSNSLLPVESTGNDKRPVEGTVKEDVVVENKGKDVEVKNSTSGANTGQPHVPVPTKREKSGGSEVGNLFVGASSKDTGKNEAKFYGRKVPQNLSETGGLPFSAQRSKKEGLSISGGKPVDSIEKGRKSQAVDKGKTKKSKKAAEKDVKSRKRKHTSVDSGGCNIKKSGGVDSVANGNMVEENVQANKEKLSAKLDEKLQYSRDQLMHLRQKPAAVSEDIFKVVKEISAQVHGDEKSPTVEEAMNASVCDKGQLGTSTEEKNAQEMVSGILKKKKRGSSSEARKEKKKQKRRKKRAELNKKLGVKRLKLKPILKPKVVPHCRHYLKGRCQEGEKCKFSHDVVPLTKSKPCCHFARHTCMKGDDCPFDHQLFKYPCNNFVETGFCSRGDSCLFSHKTPAKEGSEITVRASKSETCPLNQLDKSKSTQLIPRVSSSGNTTMKNLKENLSAQVSQTAKALKGVSFLSFGKSLPDNSAKLGEVEISQPKVDIATTSGQPNLAVSMSSDNTLKSIPASPTSQRVGFLRPERSLVDSSGTKNQASVDNAGICGQTHLTASVGAVDLKKNLMSFPACPTPQLSFPFLERNSVDRIMTKNQANVDVAGTSGQPNQIVQAKAVQLSKTLMAASVSLTPQGPNFPSLEKTSADSSGNKNQASSSPCGDSSSHPLVNPPPCESSNTGQVDSAHQLNRGTSSRVLDAFDHKLQVLLSTDGHAVSQMDNRSANDSDKFKAVHSEAQVSPSSGQCSIRAAGPVKSTPGTAKRAILSTLAFAARYESRIKMSSAATNEVKKNGGTSASGCKQKEPIKASDILERLYGGGSRKERQ